MTQGSLGPDRSFDSDATGDTPRVVIVEDDEAVREGLAAALGASGYEVRAVSDGRTIDALVESFNPDIAILDVALGAGPDGYTLAQRLRAAHNVPTVFLTAADSMEDRLEGFAAGADDYMVKPFSVAELLARMRVVLRRAGRTVSGVVEVSDLVVDEGGRSARRAGIELELTPTQFDLLFALARNAGRTLTKAQLLSMVWGFDSYEPNLVEVHVSALRRKLEAHGPRLIHTARGAGYMLRG